MSSKAKQQISLSDIIVVHSGRGGHLEIQGYRYQIELIENSFAIHFPGGHRHANLDEHRDALQRFCASRSDSAFSWYF